RWSSASSTEFFMSSPMTPCGPESVVMKPILTFSCCAAVGATTTAAAISAKPRDRGNVRTVTSFEMGPFCAKRRQSLACPESRARRRAGRDSLRNEGDGVDLDVHAGARRRRFHRRARGLHALHVLLEDAVEGGEVLHVAQEHAD